MAASGEKLRAGVVVCQRLIRPDGAGGFTGCTNEHGQSYTPLKFNMESENDGLQEELPFLGTSFQVPC